MIFFGAVGALTFGEGDYVLVLYRSASTARVCCCSSATCGPQHRHRLRLRGGRRGDVRPAQQDPVHHRGLDDRDGAGPAGIQNHLVDYLGLLGPPSPRWAASSSAICCAAGAGMPEDHPVEPFHWVNLGIYALASALAYAANETGFFVPPVIGVLVALVLAFVVGRRRAGSVA